MSDKLEYFESLLKNCALPELTEDLDNLPLQSEDFTKYHTALQHQLPTLYDFIQQNETWIWDSQEREHQQVQATTLVLLCELTAPSAVYALQNKYLIDNAARMLQQRQLPQKLLQPVEAKIFVYYQQRLKADCWKRQLGAVHGFLRFLELMYGEHKHAPPHVMSEWLTFCLAVALNLRECHEPTYKLISTRIFLLILASAKRTDILYLNIHSVIYDAVFKNIHLMDTVRETADIWNCLVNCLDFFDYIDSFSWNMIDDMIENLMRNIALAPNAIVSICMWKFLTKLCCYFSVNAKQIDSQLQNNFYKSNQLLSDSCFVCVENSSYTPFRWCKKLLELFNAEAYKLMTGTHICRPLLQEMLRCYMVCILPIALQISQHILISFWDKFTSALMEVLNIQQDELDIVRLVKSFLETFIWQLTYATYTEKDPKLLMFRNSFEALITNRVFSKS